MMTRSLHIEHYPQKITCAFLSTDDADSHGLFRFQLWKSVQSADRLKRPGTFPILNPNLGDQLSTADQRQSVETGSPSSTVLDPFALIRVH